MKNKDANEDARYIHNGTLSYVIQNNFAVHRIDIFCFNAD